MSKGKGPRKPRQTQEQAALVPPARTPSPSPERRPVVSQNYLPAVLAWAHAIRAVVGAVLDFADAAAEAITKGIKDRGTNEDL